MAIGAAILVRWPVLVTPLVAVAAPFRPPLSFGSEHRYYVGVASSGQLGRLLPLYAVLGAAALALAWQALRGSRTAAGDAARLRPRDRLPGPRRDLAPLDATTCTPGRTSSRTSCSPSDCSSPWSHARRSRAWITRALAVIAVGLATLFAVVGLVQAATHKLWFFSPSVEVGNAYSSFFRVTSLFRDPSLYGRHVVLGIAVAARRRPLREGPSVPGLGR